MNGYSHFLLDLITSSKSYADSRNGGFLHSCFTHADEFLPSYFTIANAGVSMSESVNRWWNALQAPDAEKNNTHWYFPCEWQYEKGKSTQCNPSCP
jgi:hypothetical protein